MGIVRRACKNFQKTRVMWGGQCSGYWKVDDSISYSWKSKGQEKKLRINVITLLIHQYLLKSILRTNIFIAVMKCYPEL